MNDAANTLTTLRKQLEASQEAHTAMADRNARETKELLKLITQLSQICRGHNRELDNRLAMLRAHINRSATVSEYLDDLTHLGRTLREHTGKFDANLCRLNDSVTDAGQMLLKTTALPTALKGEVKTLLANEAPYGLDEHIGRITKLMELHALALQLLSRQAGSQSTDDKPKSQRREQHYQICDELQRLIPEFEFGGEYGEKLAAIRLKLLVDIDPTELPPLCLELIRLILAGARAERLASHAFLNALNESLSRFQNAYADSLSEQAELIDDQQQNSLHLRQQLQILDNSLIEQNDWEQLKRVVRQHVEQVSQLLARKEELEAKERTLLEQLASREADIRHIRHENEEYRRRLMTQQCQLQLDSLTQLPNRGALDERLTLEFQRWQRYRHDLAIAIIDIDHFKQINDRFGHTAGDNALKVVARSLQKMIRKTDFVARFGGEEFVILLPHTGREQLDTPLEKLRQTIKTIPFTFKGERVSITVSIGASMIKPGDEMMSAFERADQALYEAKHQGRDRMIVRL